MAFPNSSLNAHEAPPTALRDIFKKYKRLKLSDVENDLNILDFSRDELPTTVELLRTIESSALQATFAKFCENEIDEPQPFKDQAVYCHKSLTGLIILPCLLPLQVQKALLSRLLHRDLSNPKHMTNLHKHYQIPYLGPVLEEAHDKRPVSTRLENTPSFFSYSTSSGASFVPKDPVSHRPLSIARVLQKGLRWMTLGGQYDWTNKVYPEEKPPPFPTDVALLLEDVFPEMKAQAAIVNLYSPGDTLSLHRDVSEKSERGLVSISVGCDCLFVIGQGDPEHAIVVRLRSGDAVFMGEEARFAWHGVPLILAETCPLELRAWPAEPNRYEEWMDWMESKRINLNVRQMHDC